MRIATRCRILLLVGCLSAPVGALEGPARNACIAQCQRDNFEALGQCCRDTGSVTTPDPPTLAGEGGCDRAKGKQDEDTEKQYTRCKQDAMKIRDACNGDCFK